MKAIFLTVISSDYVEQAKQLFSSLYFNARWAHDCWIIVSNLNTRDKNWFTSRWIKVFLKSTLVDDKIWRSSKKQLLPAVATLKYHVFDDCFKKWDIVVYSDVDIIIQWSLEGILNRPYSFMAVKDNFYTIWSQLLPTDLFNDLQKQKFQKFKSKYHLDALAFNSGFFVFQTGSLPKEKIVASVIKKLYDSFDLISKYADQHILNFYFYKSWKHIGYSYNVPFNILLRRFPYFWFLFKGHVMHVYWKNKPWKKEHFLYAEWYRNYKKADLIDFTKLNTVPNQNFVSILHYLLRIFTNLISYLLFLFKKIRQWL